MKILIDARLANRDTTGISRTSYYLLKTLLRLDKKNKYVIFCSCSDPFPEIKASNIVKEISKFNDKPIFRNLWEIFVLPFNLWRYNADVFFSANNFVAPWFPVRTEVIVTVQDLIPFVFRGYYRNILKRNYFFLKARVALKKADLFLVSSEFTKGDLASKLGVGSDLVRVVHWGIDRSFCVVKNEKVRKKFAIKRPFILSVGGAELRKNTQSLIDAYELVKTRDSNFPYDLVIAGAITPKNTVLTQDLKVNPRHSPFVHLVGRVGDEDLKGLYAQASVFVYPSFYEGFGFPVLEAMCCGTPVICSNATSIPEVVGDAAVLVDPKNKEEIAQAIQNVLGDEGLRKKLTERGKARVRLFSWEKSARKLLEIFEEVGKK